MDGRTSVIARAAQMATDEKGMVIVASAGNDGGNPQWRYVSTPADAAGVLAVGATTRETWKKVGYSGIGPDFIAYLKPDVACFSLTGTSFSAPAVTGFVACLMQHSPGLTNRELLHVVRRSGHLYPYGNNYVGYGVPRAARALALLEGQVSPPPHHVVNATRRLRMATLGADHHQALLFHKRNATQVVRQEVVTPRRGHLVIERPEGVSRTTVDLQRRVVEILWED